MARARWSAYARGVPQQLGSEARHQRFGQGTRTSFRVRRRRRMRSRGRRTGTSASSINRPARVTSRMRKNEMSDARGDLRTVTGTVCSDRFEWIALTAPRVAMRVRLGASLDAEVDRLCAGLGRTDRCGGSDRLMTHAAISISLIRIRSMRRSRLASTVRSAVPSASRLIACTVRVWPMRSTRPIALLEADRIPRQLEIDDQPAVALKVQPFGAGIGGDHHVGRAAGEGAQRLAAAPARSGRREAW